MTLIEFRDKYPMYSDMSNEDISEYIGSQSSPSSITVDVPIISTVEGLVKRLVTIAENFTPATMEGLLKKIADTVENFPMEKPEKQDLSHLVLLKEIKNQLMKLEVAIRSIDVQPMVNVSPPQVNIPASPEMKFPEIKFPDQIREWTFTVTNRGPNGSIREVVARS